MKSEIREALNEYFGTGGDNKRFFDATQIPRICNDISGIRKSMENMNEKMDEKYVTKEEFKMIKNIVYGACGLILTSVLGALVYLVVKR